MEECEALCDRLSIMAAGRFRCLATLPRLKEKYGSGYSVSLTLNTPDAVPWLLQYIESHIRGATLGYHSSKTVMIEIPVTSWDLPDVLQVLEEIPASMGVKDYNIAQNSLDKVSTFFILFYCIFLHFSCCLTLFKKFSWLQNHFPYSIHAYQKQKKNVCTYNYNSYMNMFLTGLH